MLGDLAFRSTGLYLITHSSAPERQLELWKRHRACWDEAVDLAAVPGERLQIPYEGTSLPGYFFRAPDAGPGGLAALERGYHGTPPGPPAGSAPASPARRGPAAWWPELAPLGR